MIRHNEGERFLATLGRCLQSLPFDLKILLEAMAEPDLERGAKEIAAGAVLYVLAPNDAAPPDHPHLAYVDDAVLLRLTLRRILDQGGEGASGLAARFPEVFETLDQDLATFQDYLGDAYKWLASKVDGLPRMVYRGKNVAKYLDDEEAAEFLYDAGLSFPTNYELDDEAISRMKRADLVREHLERRMRDEGRRVT